MNLPHKEKDAACMQCLRFRYTSSCDLTFLHGDAQPGIMISNANLHLLSKPEPCALSDAKMMVAVSASLWSKFGSMATAMKIS